MAFAYISPISLTLTNTWAQQDPVCHGSCLRITFQSLLVSAMLNSEQGCDRPMEARGMFAQEEKGYGDGLYTMYSFGHWAFSGGSGEEMEDGLLVLHVSSRSQDIVTAMHHKSFTGLWRRYLHLNSSLSSHVLFSSTINFPYS